MKFDVSGKTVAIEPRAVIVAGFTGRDQAAVRAHIAELAHQGVRVPARTPAFYAVSPAALTQVDRIIVTHGHTSGEAEIALLVSGAETYVTVASDHTDRTAEILDIGLSKQVCPKVIARFAWRLAEVQPRWDELEMRSWIQENGARVLYQEGTCAELLNPEEVLSLIPFKRRPESFVLLGGTLPAIGPVRGSERFWAELRQPQSDRTIGLAYSIEAMDLLEDAP